MIYSNFKSFIRDISEFISFWQSSYSGPADKVEFEIVPADIETSTLS